MRGLLRVEANRDLGLVQGPRVPILGIECVGEQCVRTRTVWFGSQGFAEHFLGIRVPFGVQQNLDLKEEGLLRVQSDRFLLENRPEPPEILK